MNKKITFLVLIVVLSAMGLVFFTHMNNAPDGPQTAERQGMDQPSVSADRDGSVSPLQSGQGGAGGPAPIEPPMGSSPSHEGAPRPVAVTAGQDPRSVRVVSEASPGGVPEEAVPAPGMAAPEANVNATGQDKGQSVARPATGTPSLTPWELPPDKKEQARPQTTKPSSPQTQADKTKPADKAKQPALSDKGAHTLKNISLQYAGQSMKLRIEAEDDFPCKSFILTGPDRLVIDLPGAWKGMKAPSVPSNNVVKNARIGQQTAGPRLVLDLSRPIKGHTVQRSDKAVEILLQ